MKYFEVKVGELKSFVNSSEFQKMSHLPISSPRAFSQSLNPNASPGDIALIYSLNEQGCLAGYIGILPAKTYSPLPAQVFFNSCWWVDPKLGKDAGMKLFYKMLQIANGRIVFFELSHRTESILRNLNGMSFPAKIIGFQGYTRINLSVLIKGRSMAFLTPLIRLADWFLNLPIRLYYYSMYRPQENTSEIILEKIDFPESDIWQWANNLHSGGVKFRNIEELRWITQNPWIINPDKDIQSEASRYRFSLIAREWKQYWLKITFDGSPIGLCYLTKRDGLLRVPYAWFDSKENRLIGKILQQFLLKEKATSLLCFNPALVDAIKAAGGFFIFRRQRVKIMAWPETMKDIMHLGYSIQDGDGDAVFT